MLVASIGAHYLLSLRYTQGNEALQKYWQFAFPPADAGMSDTVRWLYSQLEPFAMKPGGTARAAAFWISGGLGFAVASRRLLGLTAGLVVASGFALAALRIMPLYERLSLWFVPALYLGIALFADRAVWFLRQRPLKNSWMNLAVAGAMAASSCPCALDLVERGIHDLRNGRPRRQQSRYRRPERGRVADAATASREMCSSPRIMRFRRSGGMAACRSRVRTARQFPDGGRILAAEYFTNRRARAAAASRKRRSSALTRPGVSSVSWTCQRGSTICCWSICRDLEL